MKKFLRSFVMMALLAVPFVTQAQITCTSGTLSMVANAEVSTGTSSYCPGYSLYNYSYTEVIIPASAIELVEFEVKAMEFKPASTSAGDYFNNCDVYLCNTTQANLSSGFVQDLANFTLVYSGTLNYADTNWQTVVFTNSFQWDGTSNILVAVHRKHGSWTSGSSFRAYTADASLARYIYQDSGPYTIGSISGGTATTTVPLYHLIGCATTPSCMRVQNVAATNITSDGLTLTWVDNDNTGATYTVYNMSDSSVVATNLSTTTCTITGLNANTAYTFGVEVNCSATDNSSIATVTARTACGINTLPYSMGFEGFATDQLPYCWDTLASGHTSSHIFPTAYAYASNAHTGSVYYEFESNFGETEIAVLPEFDTPISGLQLNFWACATNIANFVFEVGVVESGNFVVYDTVAITQSSSFSSSNYHYYQVFFNEYTGSGDRIALRVTPAGTATSYTFFMDDIEVTEFGGCFPIENLAVSNIGSSSVTLTWHDASNSGATYTVYDMADTSVVAANINDTTYTITTLDANTSYTLGVVANCSSASESDMVTVSFRTPCSVFEAPFNDGFENGISCWSTDGPGNWNTGTGDYSSTTGAHGGSYNARITHSSTGNVTKLISPVIDLSGVSSALLSFWHVQRSWSGDIDELKVYYRAASDSAWQQLADYTDAFATWTEENIALPNPSATYQIAFEMSDSYGYGVGIDDVFIGEVPTCLNITNLTVDSTTSSSITISWVDTNNTGATYTVYDMADTSVVGTNIATTTYTVTGLDANTVYTFGVEANCSATDHSNYVTVTGRTDCGLIAIPYVEGFEGMSTNTTPMCWSKPNSGSALVTTSTTNTGSNKVKFSGVSGNNVLVMPEFDQEINGLQVNFWTRPESITNASCGTFSVGYMTNPAVDSSFVVKATYNYNDWTSASYEEKTVAMDGAPAGSRIAFRHDANSTAWYWYLDDVTVDVATDTTAPVLDSFVVVLGVNDATMGTTVPAPGTYVFFDGDTATAQAVANAGYHFVRWEQVIGTFVDSTTANPASHVIDSTMLGLNMTMTAIFEADPVIVSDSFVVVLGVNDATMGTTVPAPGTYTFFEGDTATAQAVANAGYHFVRWEQVIGTFVDTTVANPATHVIDSTLLGLSMTMTAIFAADSTPDTTIYYTLTVNYDSTMGSVFYFEGPYEAGDSAFVMAFANTGFRFVNFTEGTTVVSTDAIYEFVMTGDRTLTANFEVDTLASADSLTIITAVNDSTMGTVTPAPGIHRYAEGDVFTVTATPNSGYFFGGWIISVDYGFFTYNDTLVGAPATYSDTVTEDYLGMTMGFTAMFTTDSVPVVNPDSIVVTFAVNDATMGTVNPAPGTYTYAETDSIFVEATAFDGYQFVGWHVAGSYYGDAVDTTLYTTETTFSESLEDMGGLVLTVTALFASDTLGPNPTMYTVTVSVNNASLGTVSGAGTYAEGSTVTLTATPSENATFVGWLIDGDTITDNPYTFTITGHVTAMAIFAAGSNGIEDADMANVSVYGAESRIVVRGAEGKDVFVYDLNGRTVASQKNATENTEFRMAHTGVYLVKVGNAAAKRVMVVR